jgi:hypothetical protein
VTLSVNNNLSVFQGQLPQVVLLSDNPDSSTLWHEFWHAGLGISDAQAVDDFNITVGPNQTASEAFEHWLTGDCGANH